MSMLQYEKFRDEGWKSYFSDPAFEHGDTPKADVISYFCKRKEGEVEVDITKKPIEKIVDFEILVDVEYVKVNLNRTLRYKKKWYGEQDTYKFVALQNYLDQCLSGGYKKCLLSKQEFAMIAPKKK
tara:strand:- start:1916 stop:2293 length:378 start_codon:yes stop_codon:yes gene_type:complete